MNLQNALAADTTSQALGQLRRVWVFPEEPLLGRTGGEAKVLRSLWPLALPSKDGVLSPTSHRQ